MSVPIWPSSVPALIAAIDVLPTITDDLTADVIVHLAITVVDREEELRAVRKVLSAALKLAHEQRVEIHRLRTQQHRLLAEYRRSRGRAA